MIRIIAQQVIKQECIETYHQMAKELVEKSRQEEGCIAYELVQGLEDERAHAFVEIWKDQEAIDFHNNTEHFTRIVPQFEKFFAEPAGVVLYKTVY